MCVDVAINNRGLRGREGIRTIRIRLKELSNHCARVQNQRDELQKDLHMREQDIDALIRWLDSSNRHTHTNPLTNLTPFTHTTHKPHSRIDRQGAQNSELMSKLQHWRQMLTDQSNGSIEVHMAIILLVPLTHTHKHTCTHTHAQTHTRAQQLGEIIQEKEMIQKEYSELAGELELTVSELMAARDRIGKLLMHLERFVCLCVSV